MRLDIVIPAHDEEHRIGHTLNTYLAAFADTSVLFHVALDGCRDRTAEVVKRVAARDPRIELHVFPKLGKGGVIMETFRRTSGDAVAFVDADGATPPSELKRLVAATGDADGAIACRNHPAAVTPGARPLSRRLASAGFAATVRTVFGLPHVDTQCGAKVMRRAVIERVLPLLSSRDFVFDVDLLLTARRCGFTITEVPTIWVDQRGSKVHVMADSRKMLASVLRLWVHHHVLPVDTDANGETVMQERGLAPAGGDRRAPALNDVA